MYKVEKDTDIKYKLAVVARSPKDISLSVMIDCKGVCKKSPPIFPICCQQIGPVNWHLSPELGGGGGDQRGRKD
jgi:hypothetical protein